MDGSPSPSEPAQGVGDVTPMMAQFLAAKAEAGDALVFFRMGDFYELFFDDAERASVALDIALTRRGRHKGEDIPMCGVPAANHESYLARLIRKGFRVAICEQVEAPDTAKKRGSKTLMRREIVRFVTPGTLTEDSLLEARRNNFLGAVSVARGEAALAWADVSTGEVFYRTTDLVGFCNDAAAAGLSELVHSDAPQTEDWGAALAESGAALTPQPAPLFDARTGERRLKDAYGAALLDGLGDFSRIEISALGALVAYIALTQAGRAPLLRPPRRSERATTMAIDAATRISLELFERTSGGRDGSLFSAIDRTVTGAGARVLASRLGAPSTDPDQINRRLDAVSWFLSNDMLRHGVREALGKAPDLARATARLAFGRGGPRDLGVVRDALAAAQTIKSHLSAAAARPSEIAAAQDALCGDDLTDALALRLEETLVESPPQSARDGGFVADGVDTALDEARALARDSKTVIVALEQELRAKTEIRTLKIRCNSMLGYYVEAPAKDADRLADEPWRREFVRRQGLAGSARFTTAALADLDARIARAGEEALAREEAIFLALTRACLDTAPTLSAVADALAAVDVASALAERAHEGAYVRPEVDASRAFAVKGGRHPVVEAALGRANRFTPNDCMLGEGADARLLLVTGPNMAGKSTYLRQNALIAILAQAGSFVPAEAVRIGVVDRVFSRVGASDDLARGRSTFMVEMVETASILNQATEHSLVVLDEVGRGTSTFDGLAIAWAAVEYLHNVSRCRGLFATHYHELTVLSESLPRVANVSMKVREWKGDVIFLHEVAPGPADRSYGVAVARLAGLPTSVVRRANVLLAEFETKRGGFKPLSALPLFAKAGPENVEEPAPDPAAEALAALDPDSMSPRDALDALYRLKALAEKR